MSWFPNRAQWIIIWIAVGLIGLFPLGLLDFFRSAGCFDDAGDSCFSAFPHERPYAVSALIALAGALAAWRLSRPVDYARAKTAICFLALALWAGSIWWASEAANRAAHERVRMAFADPDFWNLSLTEQRLVAGRIDSSFSRRSPTERDAILQAALSNFRKTAGSKSNAILPVDPLNPGK